jgi:hypothetical protein
MANALVLLWGIVLVAPVIVPLDWMGRRKDRKSKPPTIGA